MKRIVALAATPAAALLIPLGGASAAQAPQFHSGTCQWNNPQAKVLCVHQAPESVCRDAGFVIHTHKHNARIVETCWWWVGSDTMIVWDWRGRVVSS